jgi:2-polyprenyl-3-methyl-5-hydroxy-6-metoxy-1,4-benzoquinol methylase
MNFSTRSNKKEWMDDFDISKEVLEQNLKEIEKINTFLGGHRVVMNALKKTNISFTNLKIMDVGCGSGELLNVLFAHPRTKEANLIGIDANKNTIEIAKKNALSSTIIYENEDCFNPHVYEKHKPDIIIMSLFLHHFSDNEIEKLLKIMLEHRPKFIVINDLQRSFWAYLGFSILSFIFRFSEITQHDGKISILRGFKKNEWLKILSHLLITNFSIRWCWAFRHQIIIKNL